MGGGGADRGGKHFLEGAVAVLAQKIWGATAPPCPNIELRTSIELLQKFFKKYDISRFQIEEGGAGGCITVFRSRGGGAEG